MDDEAKLPTKEDIRRLPRWARVAFAARCARRALPMLRQEWPTAPEQHVETLTTAVSVAEQAAARGSLAGQSFALAELSMAAVRAAREALADTDALTAFSADAADNAVVTALAAADIAEATPPLAASAVINAAAATSNRACAQIVADFATVLRLAQDEGWTDDTPVPPNVFGPLDGLTDQSSQPVASDPQVKFALRAIAEPGVSADTVARHVVEVFQALNEYTLAKYGVRVTKDEFRRLVYEHSGARV